MKVVVTGGAGFIGSHIVERWVDEGAEVHIIDNLRSGFRKNIEEFSSIYFHEGSITDKELVFNVLRETDYVHHLAAMVSVPESVENPSECVDININGLLNILSASNKYGIKKVVFSSSAAVYGDLPGLPKKIDSPVFPKSPYGITKLDGEFYLNMFSEQYGLRTVSLRYFNVFGSKQNPLSQYAAAVPIFIERALKNVPIVIYGDGDQTRDFIYVKDVVEANFIAATNKNVNGLFNIAFGEKITINDLAKKIISLTSSKSEIIYEKERKGDIKHSFAAIKETEEHLGFFPKHSLEEGLKATIAHYTSII